MNSLKDILLEQLKKYDIKKAEDEKDAAREITQGLVLYSLSNTPFFENGLFHGGTCLRILFGITRYSEDLDFSLIKPDKDFQWGPYLEQIKNDMAHYGCNMEVQDRSTVDSTVKKAFIKDSSIGQILNFSWARRRSTPEKIRIKLEVDTNPPGGNAVRENKLVFPFPHTIKTEDLPSLFAGKCNALLGRGYIKGRDWYDFLWYVKKEIEPNYKYLTNMMNQNGPWEGQAIKIHRTWLETVLREKINTLDIEIVKKDILNFIRDEERGEITGLDTTVLLSAVDTFHQNCLKRDRQNSRTDDSGRQGDDR
jgi:predicted nucleotidyltransferase component of viral defense system